MSLSVNSAATALAALQTLPSGDASAAAPASLASNQTASAVMRDPSVRPSAAPSAAQSLFAMAEGVGQALTAADAADAAGQTVLGLLQQMRQAAGQASAPDLSADARAQLGAHFQQAGADVAHALEGGTVNGVNLVDGSTSTGLKVWLGDGSTASLSPTDLTLGGSILAAPTGVDTATTAATSVATLGEAIGTASVALSRLRGQADQISAHAGFVQTLGQALAAPGDDSGDSIRLLALQVSQQLAAQPAAAVANASPQSVLALFRS